MNLDLMTVNLEMVAENEEISPSVQRLARLILSGSGYSTIGDIVDRLTSYDIEELVEICESPEGEYEFVLCTLMLAKAEGIYPETLEELQKMTGMFRLIVTGMGLVNKGYVKVIKENLTLSIYEEQDKVIFYQGDE